MTGRRPVLIVLVILLAAGAAGAVTTARLRDSGPDDCRRLAKLAELEVESVSKHACSNTFLVRTVDGVIVYVGEANHLPGEPITYDSRRRLFVGLHGETFDIRGEPLQLPGLGPLFRCPTRIDDDGYVVLDIPPATDGDEVAVACGAPPRFQPSPAHRRA